MKLSAILAPLIKAKAPHELIMEQIMAFEAEQADALEQRRESDRKRQAAKRSRDVTLRHSDRSLTRGGATRVEDKPLTTDIEPQEQKEQKDTPQAALEAVLDPERAREVVAHRQRLRKPLTPYAAKMLATALGSMPVSPAEAADQMIANGWQGVKAEYFEPRARGSPIPFRSKNPVADAADDLAADLRQARELQSRDSPRGLKAVVASLPVRANG